MLCKSANVSQATGANFESEVLSCPLPALVFFTAEWSAPSRTAVADVEAVASSSASTVKVFELDVDAGAGIASRYGVRSVPTFLLVKSGKEANRIIGAASRDALKRMIGA